MKPMVGEIPLEPLEVSYLHLRSQEPSEKSGRFPDWCHILIGVVYQIVENFPALPSIAKLSWRLGFAGGDYPRFTLYHPHPPPTRKYIFSLNEYLLARKFLLDSRSPRSITNNNIYSCYYHAGQSV